VGEKSVDQASLKMLNKAAQEGIETAWDRYEKQQPQCGFGLLGICCRNCNMGPCRIDPFGDEPQEGVCGATADTIAARNLLRMIAAGAAAGVWWGFKKHLLYDQRKGSLSQPAFGGYQPLRKLSAVFIHHPPL
jgi:hydroxylamine reductase (hybrid-cluster protein)